MALEYTLDALIASYPSLAACRDDIAAARDLLIDTARRGELAVELQQAILDDNAYVFCSFLQMNMISKANVTGYTAHACDYYQVTADLDIN